MAERWETRLCLSVYHTLTGRAPSRGSVSDAVACVFSLATAHCWFMSDFKRWRQDVVEDEGMIRNRSVDKATKARRIRGTLVSISSALVKY